MLTTSYPRFEGDYYGVFIQNLCRLLSEMGVKISVLAPRCASLNYHEDSYPVTRFPYLPLRRLETLPEATMRGAPMSRLIQLPAYLASAGLRTAVANAELVHTHSAVPLGFTTSLSCPRRPRVLTCHGSDCTLSKKNPVLATFTRRALRKSDRVVAVSDFIKNLAIRLGAKPENTETIYMGVDVKRFHPPKNRVLLKRRLGIDEGTAVIGTLGRSVPEKRVEELLYAAEIMAGKIDAMFLVGGDGRDLHRLWELAEKIGLKNIRFLGRVSKPEHFHMLCDLFVLCSPIEGLSTVLQEAMATGCITVAANAGGTPELIKNGFNGLLYEPGDIHSLASRLIEAVDRPLLANSARTTITRFFDMRRNSQRYLSIYRDLTGREI